MAIKKFLTSVADVYAYDDDDNLLFMSKTLLDTSFDVKTGSTEVRGGRGNQLLYVYFHSNGATLTLNDTQFNLAMLAKSSGASVDTGANVWTEETVTLGASGAGTVTGTPLALPNSGSLYGWVTLPGGDVERVTFSSKNFTASGGSDGDVVCVRYLALDAAAREMVIPANMLPSVVHLVVEAQLNSGDEAGSNRIGSVQMDVPKAQLSGAFTISMKSDGVSQTPLTAMCLASEDLTSAACANVPVYATIKEVIDSANWYDNVIALAIEGGDFGLEHPDTSTLVVYAIKSNGDAPFPAPVADLTFTSGTPATATIGANTGLVTTVATGTTLLKAVITAKNTIEASCTLTVS